MIQHPDAMPGQTYTCRVIGQALQRKGNPDAHPSDYLNFYAIANRQQSADPELKHNKGAEKAGAKPNKSFIHVHAKVPIVCLSVMQPYVCHAEAQLSYFLSYESDVFPTCIDVIQKSLAVEN